MSKESLGDLIGGICLFGLILMLTIFPQLIF